MHRRVWCSPQITPHQAGINKSCCSLPDQIYLSIWLPICLSVYPSIHPSVHPSNWTPSPYAVLLSGLIFISQFNEFHWSSFAAVIRFLIINYVCSQQVGTLLLAATRCVLFRVLMRLLVCFLGMQQSKIKTCLNVIFTAELIVSCQFICLSLCVSAGCVCVCGCDKFMPASRYRTSGVFLVLIIWEEKRLLDYDVRDNNH